MGISEELDEANKNKQGVPGYDTIKGDEADVPYKSSGRKFLAGAKDVLYDTPKDFWFPKKSAPSKAPVKRASKR